MTYQRFYLVSLCLLAGAWILFPHFTSLLIILFAVTVIVGSFKKELVFTIQYLPIMLVLLYFLYFSFSFSSNHLPITLDYLEYKLSLVVFPFLFSFQPAFKMKWKYVSYSFLLAVTILVVFDITQASIHYANTGILNSFYSSRLSPTHHPTYLTAFLSLAILLLHQLASENESQKFKLAFYSIIALFVLMHIPLASLSGMLFLTLFLSTAMLFYLIKKRYWRFIFLMLILFGSMGYAVLKIQPSLKANLNNTISLVKTYAISPEKFMQTRPFPMQGNEARLVVWTVAFDIFMEHPMGVGLGNLEEMMHQRLLHLGLKQQADLNYNPHNQYLQIAAELGVIGLIFFLSIFIFGIYRSIKTKNYTLLLVIASLFINCLFESMLQRQSGIVFYCFWICILSSQIYNTKKE